MNADEKLIEGLSAECDALKASNAELREQLAANTKVISGLQHVIRLVQGTHAQQVHECAVKAAAIIEPYLISGPSSAQSAQVVHIICEVFGAPLKPKDECREAYVKAFPPGSTTSGTGEGHRWGQSEEQIRWDSWREAWKLLKGGKP